MKLQVTLALVCVVFPQALALNCLQCIPGVTGTCTDTQTNCTDQCSSFTTLVNISGLQQQVSTKTCGIAATCINGSLNLGTTKLTISSQCCSTDLCNNQIVSALPFGSLNGRKCFTCSNNNCTGTVSCEGDEDQCFNATVGVSSGVQLAVKGCASKSVCTAGATILQTAGVTAGMSCCSGDLCNSAAGVKLSLLLMVVPLLSAVVSF